jgi:hypothetical protein
MPMPVKESGDPTDAQDVGNNSPSESEIGLDDFEALIEQEIGDLFEQESPDAAEQSDSEVEGSESSEDAESESDAKEKEDGEEEENGEEAPASEEAKKVHNAMQKRIGEITFAKKAAEEKVKALTLEVTELKARVDGSQVRVSPSPDNPLGDIMSLQELEAKQQNLINIKLWALKNPDGAELADSRGDVKFYSSDDMKRIIHDAEKQLMTDIPSRQKYLQAMSAFDADGVKSYPWLSDKSSQEYKNLEQVLRAFPDFLKLPNYKIAIANMFEGEKLRKSRISASKAAAEQKKAPNSSKPPPHTPLNAPSKAPAKGGSGVGRRAAIAVANGDDDSAIEALSGLIG